MHLFHSHSMLCAASHVLWGDTERGETEEETQNELIMKGEEEFKGCLFSHQRARATRWWHLS